MSQVEELLSLVADAAGDEDVQQRVGVVAYTAEKLIRDQRVAGWRRLIDLIGEPRAKALREWLPSKGDVEEERRPVLPPPIGVKELLDLPERVTRFLIDGLIETATNVLLVGYPKSYKTFVVLELAVALATGTPFLHHFAVAERRRVGLILMEDRHDRVRRRLRRIARSRGWAVDDLDGHLAFWFRPPLILTDAAAMEQLSEYVEDAQLDVLLIDNWSYVSEGESNDADNVTRHLRLLADLRRVRPELVVGLVQHARKKGPGQGKRLTDVTRNSSAFGAWHDVSLLLDIHGDVVRVMAEIRDLPEPEPFDVEIRDERPGEPAKGVPPNGALTIRVVENAASPEARLEESILDYLRDNPGSSKNAVCEGVTGQKGRVRDALKRLKQVGRVRIEESGRAHRCYVLDEDGKVDDNPSF